jgi:hypothetical protein
MNREAVAVAIIKVNTDATDVIPGRQYMSSPDDGQGGTLFAIRCGKVSFGASR